MSNTLNVRCTLCTAAAPHEGNWVDGMPLCDGCHHDWSPVDDREQDGWSERDDWADEYADMGGEDDFLDSYWEMQNEFWEG